MTVPSWSAIVRGAGTIFSIIFRGFILIRVALRGLQGPIVTRRICSRHYGIKMSHPFNPNLEVRDERVYYNHFHGKEYRNGWMKWQIEKVRRSTVIYFEARELKLTACVQGAKLRAGEKRAINFAFTHKVGDQSINHIDLYSCSLDNPPKRDDELSARKLILAF